jgi:hypothetical protein
MKSQSPSTDQKLDQGRALARQLYDLKLTRLQKLNAADLLTYQSQYPLLGQAELEDLLRQVIAAKTTEQTRVGWFTLPRDLTVLVFVLVTWLVDLRAGVVAGVAALILLESLWQVIYLPRVYMPLSILTWLTYPAYLLLAWVLYSRGMQWYGVALIVLAAWGGTFLLGFAARLPMQYYLKVRQEYDQKMLAEQHKTVKDQKK